ncbi:unnamed protein product, partial [Sphacelaria rigidula]
QCHCSAVGDDPSKFPTYDNCTTACAGNDAEICGGDFGIFRLINVYSFEKNYKFLGCFGDDAGARVLSGNITEDDVTMTTAACAELCSGSVYFGTEDGREVRT